MGTNLIILKGTTLKSVIATFRHLLVKIVVVECSLLEIDRLIGVTILNKGKNCSISINFFYKILFVQQYLEINVSNQMPNSIPSL